MCCGILLLLLLLLLLNQFFLFDIRFFYSYPYALVDVSQMRDTIFVLFCFFLNNWLRFFFLSSPFAMRCYATNVDPFNGHSIRSKVNLILFHCNSKTGMHLMRCCVIYCFCVAKIHWKIMATVVSNRCRTQ